jgi:hypothetical protein
LLADFVRDSCVEIYKYGEEALLRDYILQLLNAIKENDLEGNTKAEYRRAEKVFCHYREMNPYSVVQPLAYFLYRMS